MNKHSLLIALLVGQGLAGCKNGMETYNGPVSSFIGVAALRVERIETPSGVRRPAQLGYDERFMMLRRPVCTVQNDSLLTKRRVVREDADRKNYQFTNRYDDGYSQRFELVFPGNNLSQPLQAVIVHAAYQGDYDAKADTVQMYCTNAGAVPGKYRTIEDQSGW